MTPVTDPALLAQLNSSTDSVPQGLTPVTDPDLLAQLNAGQDAPVTATGLAQAAGTGVVRGGEGLAGLPGDATAGGSWLLGKLGASPVMQQLFRDSLPFGLGRAPTSDQIIKAETAVTGGLHDPANRAERITQNVASFLPGAIGGPEALAANVLKRGILPGVASEIAGQATEGTALEPYARVAGALVQKGAKRIEPPSAEAIKQAGADGMDAFRQSGLQVFPGRTKDYAKATLADLNSRGLDADLAGKTTKTLERLSDLPDNAAVHSTDFTALRQKLSNIAQEKGADFIATPDAKAASVALKGFDEMLAAHTPAEVVGGDLQQALDTWKTARVNYNAGMNADSVENIADKAKLKAFSQNSGLNTGNKLRSAYADLAVNGKKTAGMTDAEVAAIEKLAKGSLLKNSLRYVGNVLGGGGGIGQTIVGSLGGAASEAGGEGFGPGAVSAVLLGALARNRYNASVVREATRLSELMRSRAPLAQAMRPQPTANVSPSVQRILNAARALQIAHGGS